MSAIERLIERYRSVNGHLASDGYEDKDEDAIVAAAQTCLSELADRWRRLEGEKERMPCYGCRGLFPPDQLSPSCMHPEADWFCDKCLDSHATNQFKRDVLVAIAGAVATPEAGYVKDGGLPQVLADVQRLRNQHDALTAERDELRALFVACSHTSEPPPMTLSEAEAECEETLRRIRDLKAGKSVSLEETMAAIGKAKSTLGGAHDQR